MANDIEALIQQLPGTAGLFVEDLSTGRVVAHNAQLAFPAASLIKLPILWEYFHQICAGRLSADQRLEVPADAIVGGCGVIKDMGPSAIMRTGDLATLMIVVSDNTATNLLIEILGREEINTRICALGMDHTELQRKLFDFEKIEMGIDNYISPGDAAVLLAKLVRADGLPREACDQMIGILRKQHYRNKLPALLPPGADVANKTGEVPGIEHDAAIFFRDGRATVVAALTRDLQDNQDGIRFCAQVGAWVYDSLNS